MFLLNCLLRGCIFGLSGPLVSQMVGGAMAPMAPPVPTPMNAMVAPQSKRSSLNLPCGSEAKMTSSQSLYITIALAFRFLMVMGMSLPCILENFPIPRSISQVHINYSYS